MNTGIDPNKRPDIGPAALVASLVTHARLIVQLARREVVGRYRGSMLGLAWSFFNPLLMLAVYTFVFSVIFKARWAGADSGRASFAIFLFSGLLVHGFFAECVIRAPALVMANPSFVKRVVFPLEILPWVTLGSALFHGVISLFVLLAAQVATGHQLHLTAFYLPIVFVPLMMVTMGASWLLAGVGVYVRDIGHFIGVLVTVLLFLSPVFYPASALPEEFRPWLAFNPLTFIIEQTRAVLILGQPPAWRAWLKFTAASLVFMWFGFAVFQRLRRGFADVL